MESKYLSNSNKNKNNNNPWSFFHGVIQKYLIQLVVSVMLTSPYKGDPLKLTIYIFIQSTFDGPNSVG